MTNYYEDVILSGISSSLEPIKLCVTDMSWNLTKNLATYSIPTGSSMVDIDDLGINNPTASIRGFIDITKGIGSYLALKDYWIDTGSGILYYDKVFAVTGCVCLLNNLSFDRSATDVSSLSGTNYVTQGNKLGYSLSLVQQSGVIP